MARDTTVTGDASRRPATLPAPAPAPAPARRRRTLLYIQVAGVLVALAAVLVVTIYGSGDGSSATPAAARSPAPTASGAVPASAPADPSAPPRPGARNPADLPAFEQRQAAVNRAAFSEPLAAFATPWLPWLSGCSSSRSQGGPELRAGEKTRVVCWYGNVAVYFVEYLSVADRDRNRERAIDGNQTAKRLAPGAVGPVQKPGTSGLTRGTYVEYAYSVDSGSGPDRVVGGLWWENGTGTVAGYLLGYWRDDLGQSWEPLREVWRRNS